MAKRPVNRSEANDSSTPVPGQPRPRRTRVTSAPDTAGTLSAAGAVGQARPVELDPEPESVRRQALATIWKPSEEEIRVRAYHRFLERGGGHGREFDDWIEAERDLKLRG